MASAIVNHRTSVDGKTITTTRTVTADGKVTKDPTLAAAKVGELTTRTDNNTGTLTMASSHGITDGVRLDVYWENADGTRGHRYGMTVGTVSVNSVPIDLGGGDNLPLVNTDVTVMIPQLETFAVTAADMQGLFVSCAGPALAVFRDDANAVVAAIDVDGTNDGYQWDADHPLAPATPFGSDVVDVYLSHGDTVSRQVSAVALVN